MEGIRVGCLYKYSTITTQPCGHHLLHSVAALVEAFAFNRVVCHQGTLLCSGPAANCCTAEHLQSNLNCKLLINEILHDMFGFNKEVN